MSLSTFSPHATSAYGCSTTNNNNNNMEGGHNDNSNTSRPLHNNMDNDDTLSSSPYALPTIGQFHMLHGSSIMEDHIGHPHHDPYYYSHPPSLRKEWQHLYVLPVMLLEFLAIALTRAVLPSILLQEYGTHVYLVLGVADCIRGCLAFWACPLFGKLSDELWGRKWCLFITVLGSCAPVCSLAFFSWNDEDTTATVMTDMARLLLFWPDTTGTTTTDTSVGGGEDVYETQELELLQEQHQQATATMEDYHLEYSLPPMAIPLFVVLLSLSGIFSSTFTLVFAYISDTVTSKEDRVAAYGLALATFGLSFTIGPMAGGYLAQYNTHHVFVCSFLLTILDLLYIYFILPESKTNLKPLRPFGGGRVLFPKDYSSSANNNKESTSSSTTTAVGIMTTSSWDSSLKLILRDPFLKQVGTVAFLYYTGLWAVISTLSLYAVQHFHLSPERLGELMSALGLCTMIAEAVLVRVLVPMLGEKRSTKLGLLSFALQCIVLGLATEGWHLFVCVGFSLLGNLVYPSLSSLVTSIVEPNAVGQALGAMNGIKALTEGIGPLLFGVLMTASENSNFPGWPYWIAAVFVLCAHAAAEGLPDGNHDEDYYYTTTAAGRNSPSSSSSSSSPSPGSPRGTLRLQHKEDYVHELEFKQRRQPKWNIQPRTRQQEQQQDQSSSFFLPNIFGSSSWFATPVRDEELEEYQSLLVLSEIEDTDEEDDNNYYASPSKQQQQQRPSRVEFHLPLTPTLLPRGRATTTTTTPDARTLSTSKYHGDDEEEEDL